MNPTTTVAAGAASGSGALSVIVLLQWFLSLRGISLPADVATALGTLLTVGIHYLVALKILPQTKGS